MSRTLAAKVEEEGHEAVTEIAWLNRVDKAYIVRNAVTHYLADNPDGFEIPDEERERWNSAVEAEVEADDDGEGDDDDGDDDEE